MLMSHLESRSSPVLRVRLNPTFTAARLVLHLAPLSKVNIYQRAQVLERKMYLGDGAAGLELSQKYESWSDFLLMVAAVTSVFLPESSGHSPNHAAGVGGASSWKSSPDFQPTESFSLSPGRLFSSRNLSGGRQQVS